MRNDEIQKAIKTLIDLGVLIKFDDSLKLYHGRAGKKGDDWRVDPNFKNGGNSTGNRNINQIPALNVGEYSVAKAFAEERVFQERHYRKREDIEAQVHRIVADGEAYIISYSRVSKENQPAVEKAIRTLMGSRLSELAPVSWENRKFGWIVYKVVLETTRKTGNSFLKEEEIEGLATQLSKPNTIASLFGAEEEIELPSPSQIQSLVYKIASAFNARSLLASNLMQTIDRYILENNDISENGYILMNFPSSKVVDGKKVRTTIDIPISSEFISSWLAASGIVGLRRGVNSATLGSEIDAYYLFDQERINTEKVIGDKQRQIIEQYETLDKISGELFPCQTSENKKLFELIKRGTAEELITYAEGLDEYGKLFTSNSGVWEGFTVGEHTESVLKWLEINYKNSLPENTTAFMRLCILAHDIGKGYAYEHGLAQKRENSRLADQFFEHLGLDERLKNIAEYVIGEGQQMTSAFYVRKSPEAKDMAKGEIKELFKSTFEKEPTEEEIEGIWQLCSILQNCDSGSYTFKGITRNRKYGYHLNTSYSFSRSFTPSTSNNPLKGGQLREPNDD